MKVSIYAPIAPRPAPRPAGWPAPPAGYERHDGHEGFKQAIEQIQAAEDLGFDWVSFSEHHYGFGGLTPVTTVPAAAMAAYTKRIKLAIMGPVLAINNPVRTAEEIAIVDNISDGRVIVGLLRGTPNEYQVYSVNPAETRERSTEGMELIIKAWTEPQPFGWEGRHFQFRSVAVWPRPLQEPYPPTYVLGYHHESVEVAAKHRLGMGVSFHLPDVFELAVDHYRQRAAFYGWEPTPEHVIYRGRVHVAESDAQAAADMERMGPRQGSTPPGGSSVSRALWEANPTPIAGADLRAYWRGEKKESVASHSGNPAEGMPPANFSGSPETVVKQIRAYSDALGGVGVFDLFFNAQAGEFGALMTTMRLFAREVLPALHEA